MKQIAQLLRHLIKTSDQSAGITVKNRVFENLGPSCCSRRGGKGIYIVDKGLGEGNLGTCICGTGYV